MASHEVMQKDCAGVAEGLGSPPVRRAGHYEYKPGKGMGAEGSWATDSSQGPLVHGVHVKRAAGKLPGRVGAFRTSSTIYSGFVTGIVYHQRSLHPYH
jgi:hypothetical protein